MTSKELNLRLLEALPEIKDIYSEEVEWQEGDDTGSHVVFGDVLTPYLLLNASAGNTVSMQKIFDYIESLLQSNDEYASEVITCSVLESIVLEDTDLDLIESLLGTKTKEIWENLKESV